MVWSLPVLPSKAICSFVLYSKQNQSKYKSSKDNHRCSSFYFLVWLVNSTLSLIRWAKKKVAEFPVIFSWNDITQNTFGFFLLGGCRHFMTNFQLSGRAFQHSTFRKNNLFDFTLSVKHNLSQVLLRLTLSMNYQCVCCEVNTVSYKLSILLFKQTS